MEGAMRRAEPVGLSAMSLLEMAVLTSEGTGRLKAGLSEIFEALQVDLMFRVLPLNYEVAAEAALLASLRDPPTERSSLQRERTISPW